MLVVICNVDTEPKIGRIDDNLYAMQSIVHGYIEEFPLTDNLSLICNEEGKINGMKPNLAIMKDGKPVDVIAGDCFIVADGDDNFRGLVLDDFGEVYNLFHGDCDGISIARIINVEEHE